MDNNKAGGYNEKDPIFNIDKWGHYTPYVKKCPSALDGKGFKPLADYIHSKGLRFDIHIMRGIPKKAVEMDLTTKGTNNNQEIYKNAPY